LRDPVVFRPSGTAVAVPLADRFGDAVRVLVACMPKSGSTFLSRTLANLPGFRTASLVPGYQRREQELCQITLNRVLRQTLGLLRQFETGLDDTIRRPVGFVAQHHVRYSLPLAKTIRDNRLTPVVLVRDIFDVVASLQDHFRNESPILPMAYATREMSDWPDERLCMFIADMVVPWYLNFFRCWQECDGKYLLSYQDLMGNPMRELAGIADFCGFATEAAAIAQALALTPAGGTRFNRGIIPTALWIDLCPAP
jgi:Sulfotransferase domain